MNVNDMKDCYVLNINDVQKFLNEIVPLVLDIKQCLNCGNVCDVPYEISCGHVFCTDCLNAKTLRYNRSAKMVKCSICNNVSVYGVNKMLTIVNLLLKEIFTKIPLGDDYEPLLKGFTNCVDVNVDDIFGTVYVYHSSLKNNTVINGDRNNLEDDSVLLDVKPTIHVDEHVDVDKEYTKDEIYHVIFGDKCKKRSSSNDDIIVNERTSSFNVTDINNVNDEETSKIASANDDKLINDRIVDDSNKSICINEKELQIPVIDSTKNDQGTHLVNLNLKKEERNNVQLLKIPVGRTIICSNNTTNLCNINQRTTANCFISNRYAIINDKTHHNRNNIAKNNNLEKSVAKRNKSKYLKSQTFDINYIKHNSNIKKKRNRILKGKEEEILIERTNFANKQNINNDLQYFNSHLPNLDLLLELYDNDSNDSIFDNDFADIPTFDNDNNNNNNNVYGPTNCLLTTINPFLSTWIDFSSNHENKFLTFDETSYEYVEDLTGLKIRRLVL